MSCLWDSTSLPMLSDGWPPSDVTCSPAIAAWLIPSVADAGSPLKNTPVKRNARLVRGRDHRVVEPGRVEVRAPAGRVLLQLYVEALSVHPDDDGAEPRPRVELPGQRPRRVGLVAAPAKARQSREPRAAGRDGGRGSRPSRLQCGERGRGRQTRVDADGRRR